MMDLCFGVLYMVPVLLIISPLADVVTFDFSFVSCAVWVGGGTVVVHQLCWFWLEVAFG